MDIEAELAAHHAGAFGWALTCCRSDREEALDVLQTAYLHVLDGRARFGGRSTFRTWLFGVIRRTAAGARRRAAIRRLVPLQLLAAGDEPSDGAKGPDAALIESDAMRQLRGALARLPARQREVLHLVFYQELTIEEAGEVIGVSLGTARTHYERGKTALRRELSEELAP
jgi:RNA polymerase sigma-70 factor (ECF subfamily)